jgi:hypothetical protein
LHMNSGLCIYIFRGGERLLRRKRQGNKDHKMDWRESRRGVICLYIFIICLCALEICKRWHACGQEEKHGKGFVAVWHEKLSYLFTWILAKSSFWAPLGKVVCVFSVSSSLSYKREFSWWVYDVGQENQFAKAFFFPFRLVDCHYAREDTLTFLGALLFYPTDQFLNAR